jgi:hypothetical protein
VLLDEHADFLEGVVEDEGAREVVLHEALLAHERRVVDHQRLQVLHVGPLCRYFIHTLLQLFVGIHTTPIFYTYIDPLNFDMRKHPHQRHEP